MREHVDVIVMTDEHNHYCDISEDLEDNKLEQHHEDDNEEEKNNDHHHHCVDMSIAHVFTPSAFEYQFTFTAEYKQPVFSYKSLHSSSFLDRLFQPPRA